MDAQMGVLFYTTFRRNHRISNRIYIYRRSTLPIWLETTIIVLTVLTMLFGLFGLVIPIFPGNVVMWLAALVYGLIFGFGKLGGVMFVGVWRLRQFDAVVLNSP